MSDNFIVCYDKVTGEQLKAFESPLEPGVYLHPADSTTLPPPSYDADTQTREFTDGAWVVTDKPAETHNKNGLPLNFRSLTGEQKVAQFYKIDEDDTDAITAKISEIGGTEGAAYDSIVNPPDWMIDETPEPITYEDQRMGEYGQVHEQIEYITEHGLEAWQQEVARIKALYPKPTE